MSKITKKIGFIGLGNMAQAMLAGMLEQGVCTSQQMMGSSKTKATADKIHATYQIQTTTENRKVAKEAEILILAVKPIYLQEVIEEIRDVVTPEQLIISVAAGKTLDWLASRFDKELHIVRCMPNTPALVGEGCTGVCANAAVTEDEMQVALALLGSFGKAYVVAENQMDIVVGVSGSSPAYVFMFIEAMADAAVLAGMPRKQAYEFAAQAVLGSAKLVLETGKHPGELKDMVCSPGGTTIEAVKELEDRGFRSAVMNAVEKCIDKSRNL